MSQSHNKTAKKLTGDDKRPSDEPEDSSKLELPDSDSIVSEVSFVSPKGTKYQIIKTNERDEYEESRAEEKHGNRHRRPAKN